MKDRKIYSFSKVNQKIIIEYINYISERGKYTVVSNKNSILSNNPDKRTDYGKRVSNSTVNSYIRNIKAFFSYCTEYDILKNNPAKKIKLISNKRKSKYYITDAQFRFLIQSFNLASFSEYRDYIITNLLIDTGMRISECLLIRTADVDFLKRAIFLPSQNTKGKRDRVVYYSSQMRLMLKHWLKYKDIYTDTEYLFTTQRGTQIDCRIFEKNFKKYCKRVGLENVSPHTLRNNFAKRFIMNGGNIYTLSQILGHSSVTVTEKTYLDLTDDDIREGYQNFSPLARMR